jgi:hypothetical protein
MCLVSFSESISSTSLMLRLALVDIIDQIFFLIISVGSMDGIARPYSRVGQVLSNALCFRMSLK